jgi:type IV pilus assembly protein PilA
MLEFFRKRMTDDRGFTLIELMVVVLIIAILIAIAIPTFLGLRRRAQDRAAQSDLRNALTAAKAQYADDEHYGNTGPTALAAIEPSLVFTTAASATTNDFAVSVAVGPNNDGTALQEFGAARMSASGTCFGISDVGSDSQPADAGTWYGTPGTCTGTAALGVTARSW